MNKIKIMMTYTKIVAHSSHFLFPGTVSLFALAGAMYIGRLEAAENTVYLHPDSGVTNTVLVGSEPFLNGTFYYDYSIISAPGALRFSNLGMSARKYGYLPFWSIYANLSVSAVPNAAPGDYEYVVRYQWSPVPIGYRGSAYVTNRVTVADVDTKFLNPVMTNGQFRASIDTVAGKTYTIYKAESLTQPNWVLHQTVAGNNTRVHILDPFATNTFTAYRFAIE